MSSGRDGTRDYLRVSDVAKRCRLTRAEVRELCRTGALSGAVRTGKKEWRIPEGAVASWETKRSHESGRRAGAPARRTIADSVRSALTLFGLVIAPLTIISILADFGGARTQLHDWLRDAGVFNEFRPAAAGETLIVVASFFQSAGNIDTEPHQEIARAIRDAFATTGSTMPLRVEVSEVRLRAEDSEHASGLGRRYRAAFMIWGAHTGVRFTVSYVNLMLPSCKVCSATNTRDVILRNKPAYSTFVTEVLPRNLASCSLSSLAWVFASQGEYETAIRLGERAVQMRGTVVPPIQSVLGEAYFLRGLELYDSNRIQEAADYFSGAIKYATTPDVSATLYSAYVDRAIAYKNLQRDNSAISDVDRAIELEPRRAEAYTTRASLFERRSEPERALADYNQALVVDPQSITARWARANFLASRGDVAAGIRECDVLMSSQPREPAGYECRAGLLQSQGPKDSARAAAEKAIDLGSKSAAMFLLVADSLRMAGEHARALALYDRAIELAPSEYQAHVGRGYALVSLERAKEALASHDHAIALEPARAEGYQGRAGALYALERYPDALADYENAIKLDPANALSYHGQGNVLFQLRRYDEAVAAYTAAIGLNKDAAWGYEGRGFAYAQMHRFPEALADLTQAIQRGPTVSAYEERSLVHQDIGNPSEAKADLDAAGNLRRSTRTVAH